ncbi:4701_t:CDS:2, partial [Funneliformis caledonium]
FEHGIDDQTQMDQIDDEVDDEPHLLQRREEIDKYEEDLKYDSYLE